MESAHPLSSDETARLDAHWRALNYLAAGQLYLADNPLLAEPLRPEHIKPRLLGHWGTCPGLALVYTHLNRVITARDLNALCLWGPGHGAPAVFAGAWLEGTYGELYPELERDAVGMGRLFRRFSFPGGAPSHTSPDLPGSLQEGGELGYGLAHAYGAVLDNPDLLAVCVVGDGEAETGPLAASWHSHTFLDPVHDGAVLPVLHLNGYKIANPTVLARLPHEDLDALLRGLGHDPRYVTASPDTPAERVHRELAAAMDQALDRIAEVQWAARERGAGDRPRWPLIVLRTPKGWTGPEERHGEPVEGTWRAHQIPLPAPARDPEQLRELERWLRSYRPEELFDARGRPTSAVLACVPRGDRRLGANPHANGGRLLRRLPPRRLAESAVPVEGPGRTRHQPTVVLADMLGRLLADTEEQRAFRVFGPDETDSNHLQGIYAASDRAWQAPLRPHDAHLGRHGRVMEVLSEHLCQGWLEGYLLTGRHGVFASYEGFALLVASMVSQYVKWVQSARQVPWRAPVAGLTYLLTSHVWQQEHNGFTHQDPGFIDHVLSKSPEVVRAYLPPDANTLLCVTDRALESRDAVNVVLVGKQHRHDWLDLEQARAHCARGLGVWEWAGNERPGGVPDVVLACAGDVPTEEALAASRLLRAHLPQLAVRVVNVVDLATLMPRSAHPHGTTRTEFETFFTRDRPVVFAFHGYPSLVHRLTTEQLTHNRLLVRGYREQGSTTTPFDMLVRNDLDRYRLVMDVIDQVPGLAERAASVRQEMMDARSRHHRWIYQHGTDLPEVADWSWA